MYVCTSLFRVDQINSTTMMTNKNWLTPHNDQKLRHDSLSAILIDITKLYV